MDATFFATPAELRDWFRDHAATASELWVGFYKRDTGMPSITWSESVDEALCVGWIDGIRKRLDDGRYVIRFTPRKRTSTWSAVNIKRLGELKELGRVQAAGLAAFEARRENRSGIYAYENRPRELDEPYAGRFRANAQAWEFFQAQPPSYRRTTIWWVVSAKKEETRLKRLDTLIEQSEHGRRFELLSPPKPAADVGLSS
jgi:uncharacterized protein YdeI (YjbR/CyaY-like superfamily)